VSVRLTGMFRYYGTTLVAVDNVVKCDANFIVSHGGPDAAQDVEFDRVWRLLPHRGNLFTPDEEG